MGVSSPDRVTARPGTLTAIMNNVNISHQVDDGVRPSLLWRQGRPSFTEDGEDARSQNSD